MSKVKDTAEQIQAAVTRYRIAFAVAGVLAVVAGLLILFWPNFAVEAVAIVVGVFAIVAGSIYLGLGIFAKDVGNWTRAGRSVVGVIFIAAGILALVFSTVTTNVVALVISITVGVMWIAEGVVTLVMMVKGQPNGWTIAYVVISIAAGVLVLLSPMFDKEALRWLLGLSFIGLGIAQMVRAVRFGRGVTLGVVVETD